MRRTHKETTSVKLGMVIERFMFRVLATSQKEIKRVCWQGREREKNLSQQVTRVHLSQPIAWRSHMGRDFGSYRALSWSGYSESAPAVRFAMRYFSRCLSFRQLSRRDFGTNDSSASSWWESGYRALESIWQPRKCLLRKSAPGVDNALPRSALDICRI